MTLAGMTWQEVDQVDRGAVVLVPTGSIEQHGPHLPLFTDSLLVTSVAEAVEARLRERVLLVPTVWLGCSGHHLAFSGSLSASFEGYIETLLQVVRSLRRHGFQKFFILNGHGGNSEPNGIVCRTLKEADPTITIGHSSYFAYIQQETLDDVMEGPVKTIRHACEAEASMVMRLRPELVRRERLRDDGLATDPPVRGLTLLFDEQTEEGSHGYATLATPEKGERLIAAAVEGVSAEIGALADGFVLKGS